MTLVLPPGAPAEPDWVQASSPREAAALAGAGRTVVVTLPDDEPDDEPDGEPDDEPDGETDGETEALAAAAVYAWAGARIFRTSHDVQLALDMTESLAGRRPPALTRRGLA
jgi:hypothetical protein